MLNAKRVFAGLILLSFLTICLPAFGQKITKSKRRKKARQTTVVAIPRATTNSSANDSTSTETAAGPAIIRVRKNAPQIDVTQLSGGLGQTKTLTAPSAGTSTSAKTSTAAKSLKAPTAPSPIN